LQVGAATGRVSVRAQSKAAQRVWLFLLFFVAIYQPSTSRPPRKSSVADGFGDAKNSEMSAVLPLFFAVCGHKCNHRNVLIGEFHLGSFGRRRASYDIKIGNICQLDK